VKKESLGYIDELIERYPALVVCKGSIISATELLIKSYKNGGKLLICGNGGSAADSEHIVGELMKGFCLPRHINLELSNKLRKISDNAEYLIDNLQYGLPAISLVSHTALSTAFANDKAPDVCFAQEVLGYGKSGDVLLGISTSGNSKNVVYAAQVAKTIGINVIALTGEKDNKLERYASVNIKVPSSVTFKIQEFHLPVYHAICLALEDEFFGR
jgi:D-sedoheptulose 7-phosphate isomerase